MRGFAGSGGVIALKAETPKCRFQMSEISGQRSETRRQWYATANCFKNFRRDKDVTNCDILPGELKHEIAWAGMITPLMQQW